MLEIQVDTHFMASRPALIDCDARITEGTAYSKRLVGIAADKSDPGHPVVEIVCAPCGLGLTSCR
jgi:hypothetical protein